MFTATWKKNARLLAKGGKKFLDYKRDLLTGDRIAEIESRRADLLKAIKANDRGKTEEASKQLNATCENSLPRQKPQDWFQENVEVMFVAIVIALGLRAYYLQPFRIPTGSMQPTLNGIIGTRMEKENWPSLPQRLAEYVLRGRSYVKVVNDQDRRVRIGTMGSSQGIRVGGDVKDAQRWHFFSKSQLFSLDAKPLWLPAPSSQSYEIGLEAAFREALKNDGILKKGQVLMEGFIDTGDLVLVDKFSYHFRKPERGEVFVFETLGIKGIKEYTGPQGGGSHYIKRLVGVPGDELSIRTPDLLVNGKIPQEKGIQRVVKGGPPFLESHQGYVLATAAGAHRSYLSSPGDILRLDGGDTSPGMREYAAMGDNTGNSLDSRYWGTVKEFNLVGPALFSLWPITTGHWGFIK